MNSWILKGLMFGLALSFGSVSFAAGAGIYQRESSDGVVELSNFGSEDEGTKLSIAPDASADSANTTPAQANAFAKNNVLPAQTKSQPDAQADGSASNVDAPDAAAVRSAQYREKMLKPTLLPNGLPANPAVQRRYLMVKKSDYVAGN